MVRSPAPLVRSLAVYTGELAAVTAVVDHCTVDTVDDETTVLLLEGVVDVDRGASYEVTLLECGKKSP